MKSRSNEFFADRTLLRAVRSAITATAEFHVYIYVSVVTVVLHK